MFATSEIEYAAKQAAGNWQRFESFIWWREREIDDANQWTIVYTTQRNSKLTDESNAAFIAKTLKRFTKGKSPSVVAEMHSHWAVGYVDGFSIRVFRRGKITKAFRTYCELLEEIEEFAILDQSDYSNREYEATLSNIDSAAWAVKGRFNLPDDWVDQVYKWLLDNDESQLANNDDEGGWPDEESLLAAFESLSFEPETAE